MNYRLKKELENVIRSENIEFICGYYTGYHALWTDEKGERIQRRYILSDDQIKNLDDCNKIQFCNPVYIDNKKKYEIFKMACNRVNINNEECHSEYLKYSFDNILNRIADEKKNNEYIKCLLKLF